MLARLWYSAYLSAGMPDVSKCRAVNFDDNLRDLIITIVDNGFNTQEEWANANTYPTDRDIDDILIHCVEKRGRLEEISVPAGTFHLMIWFAFKLRSFRFGHGLAPVIPEPHESWTQARPLYSVEKNHSRPH